MEFEKENDQVRLNDGILENMNFVVHVVSDSTSCCLSVSNFMYCLREEVPIDEEK